jgi:hypothetical protein
LTRETATRTERQEGVGPSLPVVVFGQRVNPLEGLVRLRRRLSAPLGELAARHRIHAVWHVGLLVVSGSALTITISFSSSFLPGGKRASRIADREPTASPVHLTSPAADL